MDDLGAAEAPPERAAVLSSSEPTQTSTTMNVSPPPTGEKENADALQVRHLNLSSNKRRFGSRHDSCEPSPRRVDRPEARNLFDGADYSGIDF